MILALRDYGLDLAKEGNQREAWAKKFPPIDTIAETIFYTMSVYFLATLAGTIASVVLAGWML